MIKYVTGNAVTLAMQGENVAFAHGCNCLVRMGRGIAKEVKERLPTMFDADRRTVPGSRGKLGTFSSAEFPWGVGYNMYTQYSHTDKNDMVNWHQLPNVLDRVFEDMLKRKIYTLIMPKICSGLARGNLSEAVAWSRVVHALEHTCPDKITVIVVEYDPDA